MVRGRFQQGEDGFADHVFREMTISVRTDIHAPPQGRNVAVHEMRHRCRATLSQPVNELGIVHRAVSKTSGRVAEAAFYLDTISVGAGTDFTQVGKINFRFDLSEKTKSMCCQWVTVSAGKPAWDQSENVFSKGRARLPPSRERFNTLGQTAAQPELRPPKTISHRDLKTRSERHNDCTAGAERNQAPESETAHGSA